MAVRVHRLGDHNIWWDEGFSVYLSRLPLRELLVRTAADVHPPVHSVVLKYWDRLVGESEYAIRYSTVLFGVLDLALLFWLARRYLGSRIALVAMALLALSRLHVEWSQQARMYTLATALVLVSTACFLRLTRDGDRRARWWLLHGATTVVGVHTIYIFGLAPLMQSAAVLLGARWLGLAFLLRWVGVQAAALALFVPWVLLFLAQPRPTPALIYPIDVVTWLRAVYTALPTGISAYLDAWTPLMLGATALMLVPLARWRRHGWLLAACYPPLVLGPLVVFGLSYPNPVLYAPNLSVRYLMLHLPLYCLLLAWALTLLWRPIAMACAVVLVGVSSWGLLDLYGGWRLRDEYRTIAGYMQAYARDDDLVVLYSDWDWPVFGYYFPRPLERYGVGTLVPQTAESAAALGQEWFGKHPSLWLVTRSDGFDADPQGHLRRWLDGNARVVSDFRVAEKRLTLFSRDAGRSTAVPVAGEPRYRVGDGRLVGYDLPVWEIAAGERLHLASYWREGGRYVLELAGADGVAVRRTAGLAPGGGGTRRVEHEVPIDPRLTPGWYRVRIDGVDLGRVLVRAGEGSGPILGVPPALAARDDRFGGQVALVGAEVTHGERVTARLLWRAFAPAERPYTAFVQVLGVDGRVLAQVDRAPDPGRPTWDWLVGDWALDERVLEVPPGPGRLIVGLYDPESRARLRLPGGADYVELAAWER
jgi:mannosyltransferase